MTLTLQGVTKENSQDTTSLTTNQDGIISDEDPFIDSNRTMLDRASREPGWTPKAIMLEGQAIGLAIYGYIQTSHHLELVHFMIDRHYQNHGHGRIALALILQEMEDLAPHQSIYLTVHRDNTHAHHLYESFGFVDTSMWVNASEKLMVRPHDGILLSQRAFVPLATKRTA
ncbi:MAG: GNAT family N-acetyltransferase [Bacilli bacterium]|jgi:diamine N-acetyltransferase